MRIVGGRWRGRPLKAPEGRGVTRPTTDRARESMASMLLSASGLDLSDASILDAFAGSGALGLELLSRGAAWCTFVERDRLAAKCIRANMTALGASGMARLICTDALALPLRNQLLGSPFSHVLLDPPYAIASERVSELVDGLRDRAWLAEGALVLYEHSASAAGLDLPGSTLLKSKSHGITTVDLIRM